MAPFYHTHTVFSQRREAVALTMRAPLFARCPRPLPCSTMVLMTSQCIRMTRSHLWDGPVVIGPHQKVMIRWRFCSTPTRQLLLQQRFQRSLQCPPTLSMSSSSPTKFSRAESTSSMESDSVVPIGIIIRSSVVYVAAIAIIPFACFFSWRGNNCSATDPPLW